MGIQQLPLDESIRMVATITGLGYRTGIHISKQCMDPEGIMSDPGPAG